MSSTPFPPLSLSPSLSHSLDDHDERPQMEYGGQCHISGRPYTVFRWRPGNDARYKKTIICQDVAKVKNVCQVCLNDLEYNLPVQVRDQALGIGAGDQGDPDALPESTAGREYALNAMAEQGFDKKKFAVAGAGAAVLQSLRRDPTNYKRNRAKICSFFVKGECKRGAECPYRHELPDEGHQGFSLKNIQARYHGRDDPVAAKMLKKLHGDGEDGAGGASLEDRTKAPEDRSITTLFVGGVGDDVSEDDLGTALGGAGELKSVKKLSERKCAFATFRHRQGAEEAMRLHGGGLRVHDHTLTLLWGKPKRGKGADGQQRETDNRPVGSLGGKAYDSQNPQRDGSLVDINTRGPEEEGEEKKKRQGERTKAKRRRKDE